MTPPPPFLVLPPLRSAAALALFLLPMWFSTGLGQDDKLLVLRGRVLQEDGTPIGHARIEVRGPRKLRTTTDQGGAYQVEIDLGSLHGLAAAGLHMRVTAAKSGWRLELPGGVPALEVDLTCDGAGGCSLMTSDRRVGEALSRCLGPGGPGGAVALVNFVGSRQTSADSRPAPATTTYAAAVTLPLESMSRGAPSSALLAPTTLLSAPLAAPPPSPSGAADSPIPAQCRCGVDGILELLSPTPVEPAPRIEVSLSPEAGTRDTVDFFLGAPRPFRLSGVPCGRFAIRVRNLGSSPWVIVNPQGLGEIHCEGRSVTEIRVLIERRP